MYIVFPLCFFNSLTVSATIQFCSDTNHPVTEDFNGQGLSFMRLPPLKMPPASGIPRLPQFCLANYEFGGVPKTPLRFDDLLKSLREIDHYTYIYPGIITDTTQMAKWKRYTGQGGSATELPYPLGATPSWHNSGFTSPEAV